MTIMPLHLGRRILLSPAKTQGGEGALASQPAGENGAASSFKWVMPCLLPKGHYQLRITSAFPIGDIDVVRVSADAADDQFFGIRKNLRWNAAKGELSGRIAIGEVAPGLRIELFGCDDSLELHHASIRKLTTAEYYCRRILSLLVPETRLRARTLFGDRMFAIFGGNGPKGIAARLRELDYGSLAGSTSYKEWILRHELPRSALAREYGQRLAGLDYRPLISVLMPVYNPDPDHLLAAIESVRGQIYDNWELCIADDASTEPDARRTLQRLSDEDPRIKTVFRETNGHISAASNSALELVAGDYVALIDQDDQLAPNALAEIALEIGRYRDAKLIYSDEDKIDESGNRFQPHFKPDFSRELFRSQNYLNHLSVLHTQTVRAVGGWREGFEGSQDYDLFLRVFEQVEPGQIRHVPKILYHWRAIVGSTALDGGAKPYAFLAGLRTLQDHVDRTGLPASVEPAPEVRCYRLRYSLPKPEPLVSIIIPTRDNVSVLRQCISSLLEKTDYPNFEVLVVDNGSVRTETKRYFSRMISAGAIRVLDYNRPFNYSAINNFAVKEVAGELVCLLNSDVEVINGDWLSEMVSWACRPEIGCVGAKLYYPDETIQHAGVIVGIRGVAGHSHKYAARGDPGYFSRLKVVQNVSAVTAACVVVRKSLYEEVGGLDEENLKIAFNDVDFCLKLRERGYDNVWTPYAQLYHHESKSRGADDTPEKFARFQMEIEHMQTRWQLVPDPYYSVNLTLEREDFSLAP